MTRCLTSSPIISIAAKAMIASAIAAAAASCSDTVPADALVTVGSATLMRADVVAAVPKGLSEADSITFADSYVKSWVADQLVSEIAAANLPDTREIDRMTADYRRQLIIQEYERLMNARAAAGQKRFHPDTIRAYYDAHSPEFHVDAPVLRGIYVKLPPQSPLLGEVRRSLRSHNQASVEHLEKASVKEPRMLYEYFMDRWLEWDKVNAMHPMDQARTLPDKGTTLELTDPSGTHLLLVTDILRANDGMPLELATPLIENRLATRSSIERTRALRQELYQQAVADGKITYHQAAQ